MNRDTVGKISLDLSQKPLETTDPVEQMREQLSEYDQNIFECIAASLSKYPKDFYIVVITKKERLLENVLRHYFFSRLTCPTPDYDQTVYRYERSSDMLEYLWTIPSKHTCLQMLNNVLEVPLEQRDLLQFVMDFADETLFKKAQKLNGEIE